MRPLRTLAAALFAIAAASLPAAAQDYHAGSLTIEHPWARPSIGESTNSAAYMKITNGGDAPDKLLAVETDVAGDTMLHESRMEMGVMKMVHLPGGIPVPAHGSAELKPLGLHAMLMGLKRPLKKGETFPMTLVFEHQGKVPITVKVGEAAGSGGPMDHMNMEHMNMDHMHMDHMEPK
jgi:periplasmic copper chaperone A